MYDNLTPSRLYPNIIHHRFTDKRKHTLLFRIAPLACLIPASLGQPPTTQRLSEGMETSLLTLTFNALRLFSSLCGSSTNATIKQLVRKLFEKLAINTAHITVQINRVASDGRIWTIYKGKGGRNKSLVFLACNQKDFRRENVAGISCLANNIDSYIIVL